MRVVRLSGLVFIGLMILFCAVSCSRAPVKKYRVGISVPSADHGWMGGIVYWAEQAKKDIEKSNPDAEVILSQSPTSTDQVNAIENLLAKNVNALVILPSEPVPLENVCASAKAKGVMVVTVDRGLASDSAAFTVAGDNSEFGRRSGEVMAKELGGKGRIVIIEGVECPVNTARVEGFRKVMESYPDIEILASEVSDWKTERGLAIMGAFLVKYPVIDAVWAGDDDVLLGVLQAISENPEKSKSLKLAIGGGGSKTVIKKVLDGDPLVRMTVTYPPKMIYSAALEAMDVLKGKEIKEKSIVIPAEVISIENAKENYYPDSMY